MNRSRARSAESIDFARSQRACSNEFASTVWQWVRNRRCCNQKFRREYPIPPYTVDFCCVELKLVIEVDGDSHFSEDGLEHDRRRDQFLTRLGFQVLRVPGYDVIRDRSSAHERIETFVKARIEGR